MDQLLTAYLYEHKNCPLPTLGALQLQPGNATYLPGENKIVGPVASVMLCDKEVPTHSLVDYIAVHKKITSLEASAMLGIYCEGLKAIPSQGQRLLNGAGAFFKDDENRLQFRSENMPEAYFPGVVAERVIHKDVTHKMLVGDTYTDTTAMTEKLQEITPTRSRWWIGAVLLAVAGIIALVVFYSMHKAGTTGNGYKITPNAELKTYSQP